MGSPDEDEPPDEVEALLERIAEHPDRLEVGEIGMIFEHAGPEAIQFAGATVLQRDPNEATARAAIDSIRSVLEASDTARRAYAVAFLADLAVEQPQVVGDESGLFVDALDDPATEVREEALRGVANVAESAPETVTALADIVAPALEDEVADRRMDAAAYMANVARVDAGRLRSTVPRLLEIVRERYVGIDEALEGADQTLPRGMEQIREQDWQTERTHDRARRDAATALYHIAGESPDSIADNRTAVLETLDTDDPDDAIRWTIEAVGTAAATHDDLGADAISPLAAILDVDHDETSVGAAAWALGIISEAHQDAVASAVVPHLPDLIRVLETADAPIRARITGLLTYVAESEPAATVQATEALVDCLEDDADVVRWGAATALGYAGSERALPELEALASSANNQDVRAAASGAIDRIENRT